MEVLPGVSMDVKIRFGKRRIAGTRVDVTTILDAIASGDSFETVEQEYRLTRDQVLAALRYAAHVVGHLAPASAETE